MFRDMVVETNGRSCKAHALKTLIPFKRKALPDRYYAWAHYPHPEDALRDIMGLFFFTLVTAKWYEHDSFVRIELNATPLTEEAQVRDEIVTTIKFRSDDKKTTERVVWTICAPKERAV